MSHVLINSAKKCPICGAAFNPNRPNQVYCNINGTKCRNYANNKKATDFRKTIDPVRSILEKNRKNLAILMKNKREATFSKEFLKGAGVDLRYFTHNIDEKGQIRSHIYDLAIIQNENDNQVKIFKHG